MSSAPTKDPVEALEQHFGFRKFLDGQERVVSAILSGRDVMAIMPTGGGKSLCYQLPALVLDGVTVVVSPLIALMKDQVDGLIKKGIAATMINSTLAPDEQRDRIQRLRAGEYKLVYVAPERFRSTSFVEALKAVEIGLFAIDEAHCLSAWGHDFRPDYLRINRAIDALGKPQTAAFTATATPDVRADILTHLGLRDPFVSLSGFQRPNLSLAVHQVSGTVEKLRLTREIVEGGKTGIVYCATRKKVDEVSASLKELDVSVIGYHGGLTLEQREAAQNKFMRKDCDVVVATNAFGMGIDRSDVRFVVHYELPGSVEAYYQEAGRAGRDGEPSRCDLLFNYADTRTQEFFIDGSNPPYETITEIYAFLCSHADRAGEVKLTIQSIAEQMKLKNNMQVSAALAALGRSGAIERYDIPGQRMRGTRITDQSVMAHQLDIDREALEEKDRRDRAKLTSVIDFSYSQGCRQEFILKYFGEEKIEPCGNCDYCKSGGTAGASGRRKGDAVEVMRLRKALAGVARMSDKKPDGSYLGRYGKGKVVQMLAGSRSQEILSSHLDELSTYGILKDVGTAYIYEILRESEIAGLVRTEKRDNFPLVCLTVQGAKAMKDAADIQLRWPDMATVSASRKAGGNTASIKLDEIGFDTALFEKLRQTRATIAEQEGGVPAYVIFSNKTLEFLARLKPETEEAALTIHGIGEKKAEKYLAPFLVTIRAHKAKP